MDCGIWGERHKLLLALYALSPLSSASGLELRRKSAVEVPTLTAEQKTHRMCCSFNLGSELHSSKHTWYTQVWHPQWDQPPEDPFFLEVPEISWSCFTLPQFGAWTGHVEWEQELWWVMSGKTEPSCSCWWLSRGQLCHKGSLSFLWQAWAGRRRESSFAIQISYFYCFLFWFSCFFLFWFLYSFFSHK